MLTKSEILKRVKSGDIYICPFHLSQLNPNSYNITLNPELRIYTHFPLDPKKNNPTQTITIPETGYMLEPNKLYLGRTNEFTKTLNLVPGIDGRSSTGRLGIEIHRTAGFGDVGFAGTWTLEITCTHPVIVYPNMEIGQLYYEEITGEPTLYKGRYQGQRKATPSRYYKDYESEQER